MRKPDLIIYGGNGPQTLRWHLWLPEFLRRRGWQLALHQWLQSDHDRALHDHRADNLSILLTGCYWEVFSHLWEPMRRKLRFPFVPYFRRAEEPHRVQLRPGTDGKIWTLWLRWPPRREWGFLCRKRGWVHWKDYVLENDYSKPGSTSTTGRGCDE